MRVYLPCTLPALARMADVGELGPAPLTGYAVTPALIEWYVSGDTEELEYVALTEAARASLRMLMADRIDGIEVPARRVVVAAEVPDDVITMGADLEERARVRRSGRGDAVRHEEDAPRRALPETRSQPRWCGRRVTDRPYVTTTQASRRGTRSTG